MLWDESGRPIPVTNQGPIILHKFHYISSSYYRKIVPFIFNCDYSRTNVIDLKKPEVITKKQKARQNDEVEVEGVFIQVSASV